MLTLGDSSWYFQAKIFTPENLEDCDGFDTDYFGEEHESDDEDRNEREENLWKTEGVDDYDNVS